jgi:hypothetical protein
MAEMSDSYGEPHPGSGYVRPVPPLADLPGDVTGARSWAGAVAALVRRSAKPAGSLLCWAVLPALPAAGTAAVVAQAFAGRGGHCCDGSGSLGWGLGLLLFLPLLVPLTIAGGYLVARDWAGTAWVVASRAAGRTVSASEGMGGGKSSSRLLWVLYVAGVVAVCVLAGLAGDLMTNYRLVCDVLITAGPLGLTGLAVTAAPGLLYADHTRRVRRAWPAGLWVTVCLVLAYQVLVGLAVSPLLDAARVPLTVIGVLLAFLLSVPGTLVLAAASHVSYAASHTSDEVG